MGCDAGWDSGSSQIRSQGVLSAELIPQEEEEEVTLYVPGSRDSGLLASWLENGKHCKRECTVSNRLLDACCMHIDMLSIFLLLSAFCYLQQHVEAFAIIASRFVLKSPLWRATNPRSIVRMQQSIGIPSIPGSIMTDFGRTLRDDINKILVPIQDDSSLQEELRDTVYREV